MSSETWQEGKSEIQGIKIKVDKMTDQSGFGTSDVKKFRSTSIYSVVLRKSMKKWERIGEKGGKERNQFW
jgi:hypothetical protein